MIFVKENRMPSSFLKTALQLAVFLAFMLLKCYASGIHPMLEATVFSNWESLTVKIFEISKLQPFGTRS